jgi:hypothetical protein
VAAAQLQQVAPAALVSSAPADSSSSTVAATTGTAHDHVLTSFATPSVGPAFTHHAANGTDSGGDAGNFRSAWLRDLLLNQNGSTKSHSTSTASKHDDSTSNSGDTDATDECFAMLSSGPVSLL